MPSILKLGCYMGGVGGGAQSLFADEYSVLLDGTDEYINIDSLQSATSSNSTGTFSFWVKVVDTTPVTTNTFIAYSDTNANTGLGMFIINTGIIRVNMRTSGTKDWEFDTDVAPLSDGTWHHIALVQNGTSPVLYVDGSSEAITFGVSTDKTVWFSDAGYSGIDNGRIGARDINSGGNDLFLNGNINDFLYTSDAKSSGDISNIYNSGDPKDESTISNGVSYYKFDGDTVSTCTDSIGSNDGTYVNVEQADIEKDVP